MVRSLSGGESGWSWGPCRQRGWCAGGAGCHTFGVPIVCLGQTPGALLPPPFSHSSMKTFSQPCQLPLPPAPESDSSCPPPLRPAGPSRASAAGFLRQPLTLSAPVLVADTLARQSVLPGPPHTYRIRIYILTGPPGNLCKHHDLRSAPTDGPSSAQQPQLEGAL